MDISRWLVDTIYWAARTGAEGYGQATYGFPVALPARVEGKNSLVLGSNPQLKYDHAIATLTQIGPDDQVWLPFVDQVNPTTVAPQVDTITVDTLQTQPYAYDITINGTVYSSGTFVGTPTTEAILNGIAMSIIALTPPDTVPVVFPVVTGADDTAVLTLTASTAGQVLTYSAIDENLIYTNTALPGGGKRPLDTNTAYTKSQSYQFYMTYL